MSKFKAGDTVELNASWYVSASLTIQPGTQGELLYKLSNVPTEWYVEFDFGTYRISEMHLVRVKVAKRSKFNNRKVLDDGYTFDSMAEHRRYRELKLLLAAGEIANLSIHPKYELLPNFFDNEGNKVRGTWYKADFEYVEDGCVIIEDVKGVETQVFKNKKKQLLYKFRHGNVIFRQVNV